jgi:hypothetical protein
VLIGGNDSPEIQKFLYNMAHQPNSGCVPPPGDSPACMPGVESAGEGIPFDDVDVSSLADWLREEISPEDLAAFVADASVAAEEHADDAIGSELSDLLFYLQ